MVQVCLLYPQLPPTFLGQIFIKAEKWCQGHGRAGFVLHRVGNVRSVTAMEGIPAVWSVTSRLCVSKRMKSGSQRVILHPYIHWCLIQNSPGVKNSSNAHWQRKGLQKISSLHKNGALVFEYAEIIQCDMSELGRDHAKRKKTIQKRWRQ